MLEVSESAQESAIVRERRDMGLEGPQNLRAGFVDPRFAGIARVQPISVSLSAKLSVSVVNPL